MVFLNGENVPSYSTTSSGGMGRWTDGRSPSRAFACSKFEAHFTMNLFRCVGLKKLHDLLFCLF